MKKIFFSLLAILISVLFVQSSFAAESGGQVFYRFGYSSLSHSRGHEVFTDTNGAGGLANDGANGFDISAGLDTALIRKMGPGSIIGEIMADYAKYSYKTVTPTAGALGLTPNQRVTVSELTVVVAPKYRFEVEQILNGRLRPWIIPVGLAFLVNSPPSNGTTYLDIGYHAGAGVEYMVLDQLSVGVDYRYTYASGDPGIKASNSSVAMYMGINF